MTVAKTRSRALAGGKVVPAAIKAMLRPNEKIVRIASIHAGIYWKTVVVGAIAFLLLLSPGIRPLGIFLCLVTGIMFTLARLYQHFLLLILTDRRVFLRHGIIRVDTIQIRHSRIESVETEKTIMGQILGYAAVVIYGTGSRRTAIPFIADALEFRNELDELLHEYEESSSRKDNTDN